ncbi:hypothetical protein DFH08DRAFT_937686 [Mycena albidolilacea]|uniref:Uncharacterized protein n=1 Tax=Mycena albidolilacea TaxID=1033008 RepID=A0AAD6ZYA3_9AGAR|nr:hypothetical protein DFH08DRAFT_937686 [Mycena albidolilacea]
MATYFDNYDYYDHQRPSFDHYEPLYSESTYDDVAADWYHGQQYLGCDTDAEEALHGYEYLPAGYSDEPPLSEERYEDSCAFDNDEASYGDLVPGAQRDGVQAVSADAAPEDYADDGTMTIPYGQPGHWEEPHPTHHFSDVYYARHGVSSELQEYLEAWHSALDAAEAEREAAERQDGEYEHAEVEEQELVEQVMFHGALERDAIDKQDFARECSEVAFEEPEPHDVPSAITTLEDLELAYARGELQEHELDTWLQVLEDLREVEAEIEAEECKIAEEGYFWDEKSARAKTQQLTGTKCVGEAWAGIGSESESESGGESASESDLNCTKWGKVMRIVGVRVVFIWGAQGTIEEREDGGGEWRKWICGSHGKRATMRVNESPFIQPAGVEPPPPAPPPRRVHIAARASKPMRRNLRTAFYTAPVRSPPHRRALARIPTRTRGSFTHQAFRQRPPLQPTSRIRHPGPHVDTPPIKIPQVTKTKAAKHQGVQTTAVQAVGKMPSAPRSTPPAVDDDSRCRPATAVIDPANIPLPPSPPPRFSTLVPSETDAPRVPKPPKIAAALLRLAATDFTAQTRKNALRRLAKKGKG